MTVWQKSQSEFQSILILDKKSLHHLRQNSHYIIIKGIICWHCINFISITLGLLIRNRTDSSVTYFPWACRRWSFKYFDRPKILPQSGSRQRTGFCMPCAPSMWLFRLFLCPNFWPQSGCRHKCGFSWKCTAFTCLFRWPLSLNLLEQPCWLQGKGLSLLCTCLMWMFSLDFRPNLDPQSGWSQTKGFCNMCTVS